MWRGVISEDGSEMEVYDHNDDHVRTLKNDGSGFSRDDIKRVARDHADGDRPTGYNQEMLMDLMADDIKIDTRDQS